jgi:hypothetical protein
MATRSNIGARQDNGKIKAIYCHWDGYPEGVGLTLSEHYTDRAKIERLLELGDISALEDTEPENITSYAMRGETGTEARFYDTLEEWQEMASNSGIEYLYLYEKDAWNEEFKWSFFSVNEKWHALPVKITA